jgi:hypothetical protein
MGLMGSPMCFLENPHMSNIPDLSTGSCQPPRHFAFSGDAYERCGPHIVGSPHTRPIPSAESEAWLCLHLWSKSSEARPGSVAQVTRSATPQMRRAPCPHIQPTLRTLAERSSDVSKVSACLVLSCNPRHGTSVIVATQLPSPQVPCEKQKASFFCSSA